MLGTTDQQILRSVYTWGGEAPRTAIENDLQTMVIDNLNALRSQGFIHVNGQTITLTGKGAQFVEMNKLVSLQQIESSQKARALVKKALKSVLDHDITGYNSTMQEAHKSFPPRFVHAVERFYFHNMP